MKTHTHTDSCTQHCKVIVYFQVRVLYFFFFSFSIVIKHVNILHHTLTCNFLKVFIEILQSCFITPFYDISHAELWWEKIVNTSWNSHFSNFLTDRPFLKTLKAQKIESIKGKSLITLLYFPFFSHPQSNLPILPSPKKAWKLITHNIEFKLQHRSYVFMVA